MRKAPMMFENQKILVSKLKQRVISDLFEKFYCDDIDLKNIVKYSVGPNTYRGFRISSNGNRPSVVFREWAFDYFKNNISFLSKIKSQADYDKFLFDTIAVLASHWNDKMACNPNFGCIAKLINLTLKSMPNVNEPGCSKLKNIIPFLHVPLESFSILGLKKILQDNLRYRIPSKPSMGYIEDKEHYLFFQNEIRRITKLAKVYPIHYDLLAWDSKH